MSIGAVCGHGQLLAVGAGRWAPGTFADANTRTVPSALVGRDALAMDIITLGDAPDYDGDRVVAQPLLEGSQCNVRVIRLSPGQVLPPHTHGSSDLMLFVVEGEGTLDTGEGDVRFGAGSLAF